MDLRGNDVIELYIISGVDTFRLRDSKITENICSSVTEAAEFIRSKLEDDWSYELDMLKEYKLDEGPGYDFDKIDSLDDESYEAIEDEVLDIARFISMFDESLFQAAANREIPYVEIDIISVDLTDGSVSWDF